MKLRRDDLKYAQTDGDETTKLQDLQTNYK